MQGIRALIALVDFNLRAARGTIEEPTYSPYGPNTGIECPSMGNLHGTQCKAHLWDVENDTDTPTGYQSIACDVCDWFGYRRIGRKSLPKIKVVK